LLLLLLLLFVFFGAGVIIFAIVSFSFANCVHEMEDVINPRFKEE
jgi:hypothetical protein